LNPEQAFITTDKLLPNSTNHWNKMMSLPWVLPYSRLSVRMLYDSQVILDRPILLNDQLRCFEENVLLSEPLFHM